MWSVHKCHCLRMIWEDSPLSARACVSTAEREHQGKKLLYYFSDCNKSVASPLSLSLAGAHTDKPRRRARGSGCSIVHCISPPEWLDPFTSTDKGMKGNKVCILSSQIHLSCPFMLFRQTITEGKHGHTLLNMNRRKMLVLPECLLSVMPPSKWTFAILS